MPDYLNIAGRVRTTAADGVVAEAQEVKDLQKNKSQQELNNDFSAAIEAILLLIPSAASSLNQLADKAFVNSSIATASATFRGTYNLVSDLNLTVSATHAQIGASLAGAVSDEDNNDYAFVQVPTSDATPTQIAKTERYKFNGTAWEYEYDLNNSGYTTDQWAAINSGITAALVSKLSALPTNAELTAALGLLSDGIAAINGKIPSEASSSNKLVDNSAMVAYIGQIIDAIDATFNVTSTDGHVTVQITQVNGVITAVNVTTSDIASAADLSLIAGRVTTAEGNISTNAQDIANLQQLYNNLQQSAPQVIEPTDTWPVANPSTTVIYRVVDRVNTPPQYYSDYMYNGTTMVQMAQYNNAIDPRPKKGSQNLVTSGGVFDNMGALDVSELNATENPHTLATYADLSAAIAAIPSDYQKGGMSIKFVQSSDNKYVQYMYNGTSTAVGDFTNTNNWEKTNLEKELGQLAQIINGSYVLFDLVEDGTPTGENRYLATWDNINKVAGDKVEFITNGIRPSQLTVYEYTTGNSTLLTVVELDSTHGYVQTLEGNPFTGINFIGVTSGANVYINTGVRQNGLVDKVDEIETKLDTEIENTNGRINDIEDEVTSINDTLDGSDVEFNVKDGTSTGENRYLATWADINKSAGDKVYFRTSGIRPNNLTIYEYTNANSTLLTIVEIDSTHGYVQTLEGGPFTGVNFIGVTSSVDVYVDTDTKEGGLVDSVKELNAEINGSPSILEIVGDGTQKFVSWATLNKSAGDIIEFETEGVSPSQLNIYEYTTNNSTLLTVTEISSNKGSVQTLEGGAYTGINFTNLGTGKKVRFVVGLEGGIKQNVDKVYPYIGKNAITLGDSHSQNRAKWLPIVCDKLRMNYLSDLNAQLNVGNTVPSAYEVAENPLLAQVMALKDNIGDNSVDVIFLEDVHYVFKNYNNTDETISAYPFKPTQLITLRTYNGTKTEEQADFEQNYATLLSGISLASRKKKTLMKSICNGTTRKLTFSADTISDGLLTITIDGKSFSTQVSSTMSLARVVLEVNSWQFGDTTDWRNVDRGTDYITLLYEGSGDASISFSYNSGGTGISLSMGNTESYNNVVYRYFASADLDNWIDIAYWETFRNNWYNGFSKWKGVIEELQSLLPNAEIIILSLADYSLSSADEDFDMDALTRNAEYVKTKATKDALNEVANLYGCKFLDIWDNCGISPFNWFTFYPADTVHPNDDGYARWADTIIKLLH